MTSKPHSVLDDLDGLREEAEDAHNRHHDWKKVPYWDCPLSPCSWFNNDLPLIEEQIRSLFEQYEDLVIRADERSKVIEERNENLRACGERSRALAEKVIGLEEQLEALRETLERIGWHELTWKEARDAAREALASSGREAASGDAAVVAARSSSSSRPDSYPAKEPKA